MINLIGLNKKLAEWAGFTSWNVDGIAISSIDKITKDLFFTESLDACFKWLIPILPTSTGIAITKHMDRPTFYCKISGFYYYSSSYTGTSTTPSMAVCKAIEKFIDTEK